MRWQSSKRPRWYYRCKFSNEYIARFGNNRFWRGRFYEPIETRRGWLMNSPDRPEGKYRYVLWDGNRGVVMYHKDFIDQLDERTAEDPAR